MDKKRQTEDKSRRVDRRITMTKWKIGTVFVVFVVTLVFGGESSCQWKYQYPTNEDYCRLVCVGGSNLTDRIEEQWATHPQCHAEGVYLELKNLSDSFPNKTLPVNWFDANIKVWHLECDLTSFYAIQENAFDVEPFKSTRILVLVGLQLNELKTGTFNGLASLGKLNIKKAVILKTANNGVLDVLSQTLKEFTIDRSEDFDKANFTSLQMASYTGSEPLKVEYMSMRYYIHEIASEAFVGLTKIKTLDLSNCGIVAVQRGAFEPISSTLKALRIENNPLVNLASGLFDPIPLDTVIYLGNNTWLGAIHCECQLPSNFVFYACDTNLCNKVLQIWRESTTLPFTKTTSTEEIITPPANAKTTVEWDHLNLLSECETDKSTINMRPSSHAMNVESVNKSGIVLSIDGILTENSSLIWFASVDQDKRYSGSLNMNCLSYNDSTIFIDVSNLKDNSDYIICVVNVADKNMNCISYTNREQSNISVLLSQKDNNVLNIIVMTVAFSCGILFGVIFVFVQRARMPKEPKYYQIKS